MSAERRKSPRVPGHSQAALVHIGNRPPIMCTVADVSEGGVGLTFVNIAGIPDSFTLEIKGEAQRRACTVAWRHAPHRLGVAFADAAAPAEPSSEYAGPAG